MYIVVPKNIKSYAVNWHHTYLIRTGMDCTEGNIILHKYWPNQRDETWTHIKV